MSDRQGADDQRLDWAMREVTGAEAPPDLTAAVLARHRAGDGARLAEGFEPEPPRTSRWLAAAAVLLGVGVVFGVALWPRGPTTDEASQVPAQEPASVKPAQVSTRAEIEALPAGTLAVVAEGLDDDAVAALLRLRELRELEIRYPFAMVLGLGLKTTPPRNPRCVTAASFGVFAQLTKLRALRLRGAYGITEAFGIVDNKPDADAIVATTLGQLERLPLLEELELSYFDLPAYAFDALPRLRSLKKLDLTANYGLDASEIRDVLVRCAGLRSLSLHACMTLPVVGMLSMLPNLEELDVGDIDGINWRSAPGDFLGPRAKALMEMNQTGMSPRTGVTDEALRGLARSPKLRVLNIAQAHCTLDGLVALHDLRTLRELDISGIASSGGGGGESVADRIADCLPPALTKLVACGDYGDGFCTVLRANLPKLTWLEIPACYRITDAGLAELVRIPSLRHLDIRQSRGLTAEAMPSLRTATQLEFLDLRHIDWVTPTHIDELRAALPKLHELLSNATQDAPPQRR